MKNKILEIKRWAEANMIELKAIRINQVEAWMLFGELVERGFGFCLPKTADEFYRELKEPGTTIFGINITAK